MDYLLHILVVALIYSVFALSLNLELGYAGLYNFGHVAFLGIGAYTSALLSLHGMPVLAAAACAMAAAGIAGVLLSFPALRLIGDYFGISTLVFAEMIRLVFLNERWLTKGPMGLPGIPRPAWTGAGVEGLPMYLLFCTAAAGAVFVVIRMLKDSPFGRALKVIREDEHVAQALGKNVFSLKLRTMAAGSMMAGLAGSLWAHYVTYISPADFTLNETILVLLCVVLGGKGTTRGPVVGAFAVVVFAEMLRFLPIPLDFGRFIAPIQGMIYGAVLVLLMRKRPDGLVSEHRSRHAQA